MKRRRVAGLCYKCGEKYHSSHVCQSKALNTLQGTEELFEVYDEDYLLEEEPVEELVVGVEEGKAEPLEIEVSVHALSGEKQQDTIKVQGEAKNKMLTILIDTGSTHSFIDLRTAKNIKAQMVSAAPLVVIVANGQKYLAVHQELHTGECCVLNHCYVPKKEDGSEETTTELLQVLVQFEGVFEKPKELPPQRVVDHKIPLQPGSAPVNLRPSRHSHEQKEEIEKQVREMLQATIIQPAIAHLSLPYC
uniref:Uncharacterized protein n=1 Tax=Ananas comosus var. bracteatus TaxID=296719 RepID=A0A6V7PP63_ANACO|nr:unnamed protein product [Ananas comosus var. bracteatus]